MKKVFFLLTLIVFGFQVNAQSYLDAKTLSQNTFGGTARSMGVGGAFGALGADFSSLSINPAGIGMYRSNEFTFSPSLYFTNNDAQFLGTSANEGKANFNISNVGLIFANKKDETGWVGTAFGFGLNRQNNFHDQFLISGYNSENSITQYYSTEADGVPTDELGSLGPLGPELAYNTYLINPNNLGGYDAVANGNVQQTDLVKSQGATTELVFAFGGNYNNKLYVGGTFGIPIVEYRVQKNYVEEDINNLHSGFDRMVLNENIKTSGGGVNLKLGANYKVTQAIRIGGAFHSPTFMTLTDEFSASINSNAAGDTGDVVAHSDESPFGAYEYNYRTPYKLIGSAAFIIKKYGFISVDYEYVDYSFSKYSSDSDFNLDVQFFSALNQTIQNELTNASNIRVGGELVLDSFRLRGGYAIYGNPLKNAGATTATTYITGGLGYRGESIFVDLAYVYGTKTNEYNAYILRSASTPTATIDNNTSNIVTTVGWRF